jgi:hypothetical protein
MLVRWHDPNKTVDMLTRVNIVDTSGQNQEVCDMDNAAFGNRVFTFDLKTDMRKEGERWMHVSDVVRPLILIESKPPLAVAKLV